MRVGLVGCGLWGRNLVRNLAALDALEVVCDVNPEALAELPPGTRTTTSFAELLAGDSRAVVIATPAETHFELTARALRAGCDVLVEKPMALTFEHGAELVRLAREQNRLLMVGHVVEYHPAFLRLRQLVQEGELGRIYYVYSNRLSLGRVRREENILWSFAPHDVAAILRLVGELPRSVLAAGGSYLQPSVADVTMTHLEFANGVRANIHVSWLHPFKEQRLVVVGSHKMAVFDGVAGQLLLYDQRVEIKKGEPVPIRAEASSVEFEAEEPLRAECRHFLEALKTRHVLTDGLSGLRVLAVLELAQRSLSMGGLPMQIDSLEGRHECDG